jgi:putative PIN family toxin of toxin-antitoxin system
MRVVFDTNVLVSALMFEDSMPAQAFFSIIKNGEVLISTALITEIHEVIYRPKFDKYITDSQREDFMLALVDSGTLIEVTESIDVCRDPKDNMILELAVSGKAKKIVTGDSDLLELNPFQEIEILNPQTFLKNISSVS